MTSYEKRVEDQKKTLDQLLKQFVSKIISLGSETHVIILSESDGIRIPYFVKSTSCCSREDSFQSVLIAVYSLEGIELLMSVIGQHNNIEFRINRLKKEIFHPSISTDDLKWVDRQRLIDLFQALKLVY